ncbi:MAG: nucleotidyltransferase family protein, partial [Bacillota bacterium]|nr:nucleotidyltransferase family protein [Bacillota bacterium]
DRFPSSLLLEAAHINTMYALILYRIRTSSAEELRNIRGMDEGLENRIIRAALRARSFEELIALCDTKRFSTARIKRTLIAILLQICPMREPSSKGEGGYIRVLAFDNEGKKILSRIRDEGKTEIITKESKTSCENPFFKLDKRAAAVYATIKGEQNLEHSVLPYYNQGLQV